MSRLLPCVTLALMGLLFSRSMAWTSSGKTHPELVNNLYSECRACARGWVRVCCVGRWLDFDLLLCIAVLSLFSSIFQRKESLNPSESSMCCWLLTEVTTSSISRTWIPPSRLVSSFQCRPLHGVHADCARHSGRRGLRSP